MRNQIPRNPTSGRVSDELDESDYEEPPVTKRRRQTKREKEIAKFKEKKRLGTKDDEDDNDDDNDNYTALSKSTWTSQGSSSRPVPGSFQSCAQCEKQFTVTKYTVAASLGRGFLCHQCAKASGADPFKKPSMPKKRKAPAEKRNIQSFEEKRFPSLVSICIKIVTKHIEDVEALGDIGAVNMEAIAKALAKNRCLTPDNAHLFFSVENVNLVLYDCTKLTTPVLESLSMLNPNLNSLRLDFCGHLDTQTFMTMSNHLPHLKRIELLGPFLVRSEAWIHFFTSHPQLEGFLVTQCSRFDLECVRCLFNECKQLEDLRLREMKIDDDWLLEIAGTNQNFDRDMNEGISNKIDVVRKLKCLDLSSPASTCSEGALIKLLRKLGPRLEALNLSGHDSITDEFIEDGLGKWMGRLERLCLSACPEITDRAVSRLFNSWAGTDDITADEPVINPDSEDDIDDAMDGVNGPVRSWNRVPRNRALQDRLRLPSLLDRDEAPCMNRPLVSIELGRNSSLGTRSLLSIIRHSGSHLEILDMNGWKDVTVEALQEIGKHALQLKKLDVGWCRALDDFILASWIGIGITVEGSDAKVDGGCLKLTEIKVWGCNRVTGKFSKRGGVNIHGIESLVAV
ncbi:hypothetical protein AMATHDRAFT_187532 [Amanita thiersii Skay4041]|uniref:DNA repair protein rhp7 treble clef domain-containing protein n=1 Tax=Amanita thiersii Skay4041 TaxID=703135 RepID=A0A2A9NTU5_9AGAR|nr:hypothetical protein AMATHDRAFT_187532 [Amanita thiersii Skay4041]